LAFSTNVHLVDKHSSLLWPFLAVIGLLAFLTFSTNVELVNVQQPLVAFVGLFGLFGLILNLSPILQQTWLQS
jgi:hypothetical protein